MKKLAVLLLVAALGWVGFRVFQRYIPEGKAVTAYIPQAVYDPQVTVKGEVFVVTNGAQNIRLGRIAVSAYEPQIIREHLQSRNKMQVAALTEMLKRATTIYTKYKETEEQLAKANDYYWQRHGTWDEERAGKAVKDLKDRIESLNLQTKEIAEETEELNGHNFLFRQMPPTDYSAMTDSDGKYQLKVPKNRSLVVVAYGKYLKEELIWMMPIPTPKGDVIEMTLSNDNRAKIEDGVPMIASIGIN